MKSLLSKITSLSKLINDIPKIHLVGITPLEKEKNYLINKSVPVRFKIPNHLISWTFVRLETKKGCIAYFKSDCDSQNYWGGLYPQN